MPPKKHSSSVHEDKEQITQTLTCDNNLQVMKPTALLRDHDMEIYIQRLCKANQFSTGILDFNLGFLHYYPQYALTHYIYA